MAKAQQKESKELTFDERKKAIEREVQIILDKYHVRFEIAIPWGPKGPVPQLLLVDLNQKKDEEKSAPIEG